MTKAGSTAPDLWPLLALDSLSVGPVRVEKRRITVPYIARRHHGEASFDLAYSWEEDVFEAGDPGAENLAAMIGAQVALNYGLFCRQITFHGPFDHADRRFLREMARNTAREIYVNKILFPNRFLIGDAAGLGAVRAPDYLQAELCFPDAAPAAVGAPWGLDQSRHAVLSSGGKDSLLSFGLLRELGVETHPLFVNESGRHWFSALNGFRTLRAMEPLTARVWTNSDRMFAWMLRQLPFVRQDFAKIRSDAYPVRLWTVAVFLFGVLPLVRKRRLGRLVIGDENDTSRWEKHEGIPHYAGLYDQSIWFDAALTRYFRRKEWGLHQLSLLRPISELLIEKILVERYPDLLASQMSCHAAHAEGERMKPCGRCEKCRRIVAMLVALGADPALCGYSAEQVRWCMHDLRGESLHQEQEDVVALMTLLAQRGVVPTPATTAATGPADGPLLPLCVKFDPRRSPVDVLPEDLRPRLLEIYRHHAVATVERNGRGWQPWEPSDRRET
jgi:hypothetical protein